MRGHKSSNFNTKSQTAVDDLNKLLNLKSQKCIEVDGKSTQICCNNSHKANDFDRTIYRPHRDSERKASPSVLLHSFYIYSLLANY